MAQPTATTAGTVAHAPQGHGDGEFPPFNTATYPAQLVWLALTFGFLYVMMVRTIVPRLSGIIDTRRRAIADDLGQAADMRKQAEEAGHAYEAALADARSRAQAIAQETRASLSAETDSKRKALEAELATRLAGSDELIRTRTAQAMSNVRDIAADTAGAIIERLTGKAPDPVALAAALNRSSAA